MPFTGPHNPMLCTKTYKPQTFGCASELCFNKRRNENTRERLIEVTFFEEFALPWKLPPGYLVVENEEIHRSRLSTFRGRGGRVPKTPDPTPPAGGNDVVSICNHFVNLLS